MITFNISIKDRKLPEGFPYQIIPTTRSYLNNSTVMSYKEISNEDIVIHSNYVMRCFKDGVLTTGSRCREQLRLYVKLARRLGSKYILVHLPATLNEFNNFVQGFQVIIEEVYDHCKFDGEVLLEITSWSKELLLFLNDNHNKTYKESITFYLDTVINAIKASKLPLKVLIDSAHIYNNGCVSYSDYLFTYNLLKKNNLLSTFIHLNGNYKAPYTSDKHVPYFFTNDNHMYSHFEKYEELINHILNNFEVMICENSFISYPVIEQYYEDAQKRNLKIISLPSSLPIPYSLV